MKSNHIYVSKTSILLPKVAEYLQIYLSESVFFY